MAETMWVKSGLEGDVAERVALFEWDDAHPNGNAFVAGSDSPPVEVGRTAKVMRYLHDGRLREADPGELAEWREERERRRQEALQQDAALFPGAQRGDHSNRIAALEAQIAMLQSQPAPARSARIGKEQSNA